jgi:WD40 repeat protein
VGLARVAQQLRKHTPIATDLLDLKATIKRTVKAGGWFTPVTGSKKTVPEYLVLIDRTTFKDHHSHLIDALVNQLIAQGVFVTRYYFDGEPRHCYPENDELPPLLLTELSDNYPAHRLLIFADGNSFIDPISGEIVPWIEQFSVWSQKTLLTLGQPQQWGYKKLLEPANFLVMPANETGLTTLAEQIKAEQWQPDTPHPQKATEKFPAFPADFNDFSQWWLERHAPSRAKVTKLLEQVHDFFGEDGYYWFSACAVYPELRWQLTLYLGYNLKATDGSQLLTNDRLAKLASLPWFRYGYMPNWLREQLVDDLSLEQNKAVRTELNVLWAKASDKPISDFCFKIAHEQKAQLSKLGEQLLSKWTESSYKKSPLRDYVFLSFMPLSKLAVKISNRLFTYPKMSMKTVGAVIAVSLLVGILSFVFLKRKPQYDQHALVVGINQYQYAREVSNSNGNILNNLKGAVNDALLLRDALRNIEVQLPNKWVLLDANATRANFVRAWQDMIKQAQPGDTLIITFSGKGGQQTDIAPLDEKDNKDEMLMFHDFNPQQPTQGKITDDEIYGMFTQASAYKILFVVDASYSGGMVRGETQLSGRSRTAGYWLIEQEDSSSPSELPTQGKDAKFPPNNVTIITATEHDVLRVQETILDNKSHGALSWFFAKALEGKADGNKNGFLERDELNRFLREKVLEEMNNSQMPKLLPRADGQSVIRISLTSSAVEPKLPVMATLSVSTNVPREGAWLFINKKEKGFTPIDVKLQFGTYDIRIEKNDYFPFISKSVNVTRRKQTLHVNLKTVKEFFIVQKQIQRISSVAFSPDGYFVLSGSENKKLLLWNLKNGEMLRTFSGHSDVVTSIGFSPDGRFVLSGSKDKTVRLWKVSNGKLIDTFKGHSGIVKSVAFSPDGHYALSGSYDKTIRLWDVSSGSSKRVFKGDSDTIRSVAFSLDGKYVLSGSEDKIVRLWKKTGQLIQTFHGHTGTVHSVVLSPDGNYILSASADRTVRLWDRENGELLHTFKGHTDEVYSVKFSSDGQYILSGSWDKTVRLWNVESGILLHTFKKHGDIFSVNFSPDDSRIVSGGNDGIFLWDTTDDTQHIAQMISFKDNEWVTFLSEGYFVASPKGGQKLSIWIRGKKLSDNAPFNRPDIVKNKLDRKPRASTNLQQR